MRIYESKQEAISDNNSTAWTFTIVGVVGLLLLIPFHTKLATFSLVVIILMLLAFTAIGIFSFLSSKKIAVAYDKQQELITSVIDTFHSEKSEAFLSLSESEDDDLYFVRSAFIEQFLQERFPEVDDKLTEYLIERIYVTYFADEDAQEEK